MFDSVKKFAKSAAVTSGPSVTSAQAVNTERNEFIKKWEEETGDRVVSYTFVAEIDPATTDLCRELNGRTFDANDPERLKYTAPLHYNCRSSMQVNTTKTADNPEITTTPLILSKKAQEQLVLSERTNVAHKSFEDAKRPRGRPKKH